MWPGIGARFAVGEGDTLCDVNKGLVDRTQKEKRHTSSNISLMLPTISEE